MGLGLTICKMIIQMLEGNIFVESEPEIGSNFFFKIPIEVAEEESNFQTNLLLDEVGIGSENILSQVEPSIQSVCLNQSTLF